MLSTVLAGPIAPREIFHFYQDQTGSLPSILHGGGGEMQQSPLLLRKPTTWLFFPFQCWAASPATCSCL